MTVQASAPGKLVLLGEYAVLDGAPALVAAVDRRARVEVIPTGRPATLQVSAPDIGIPRATANVRQGSVVWQELAAADAARLELVSCCVEEIVRSSPDDPPGGLAIALDTGGFVRDGEKIGIGSSAAAAVSLCGALLAAAGVDAAPELVLHTALAAHRRAQGGRGSGIDVAAAVAGGVTVFRRPDDPRHAVLPLPAPPPLPLRMVAVWSGRSASTSSMLSRLADFRAAEPATATRLLAGLGRLARAGCRAWTGGNVGRFLDTVRAYARAMDELGTAAGMEIMSREHAAIAAAVRPAGGACKPSGAGGGDLSLVFCSGDSVLAAIEGRLAAVGFAAVDLRFDERGLDVRRA